MNQTNWTRYFSEAAMIIFSVLFALFINRCSENSKLENRKEEALQSILMELQSNAENLKEWKESHSVIKENLYNVLEGKDDSLKQEMTKGERLNLAHLSNRKSFINSFLLDASWKTANNTGIISEFGFPMLQGLTQTYTLQEVITEKTVGGIIDIFFDKEAQNIENIEETLYLLNLRFQELIGQENLLEQFYQTSIRELEKQQK